MSDANQNDDKPAEEAKSAGTHAAEKRGSGATRVILFALLIAMVGLLGWDLYARSVSGAAFEKIEEWVKQNRQAPPEEVRELLGRAPDNGLVEREHYMEETYSWRRGNLLKTYFVTVLYAMQDGKPTLHEVVQNTVPDTNDIPNAPLPGSASEELEEPDGETVTPPEPSAGDAPSQDAEPNDSSVDADQPEDESESGGDATSAADGGS